MFTARVLDEERPGPGRSEVHELLDRARAHSGGGLVVQGQPGIGKTSLLRYAADAATGFVVLTAEGVEAESDLAFAALHRLLMPLSARISSLPRMQAATLTRAMAGDPADVPGELPLCVAVLELLVRTARRRPVLVCVDDVHLIDDASRDVLAFVGRRLASEKVAMLFAAPDDRPAPAGLPSLTLPGLDPSACTALIDRLLAGDVAADVAAVVGQSCAGNPRAIEELTRTLSADQRAGRVPLPDTLPLYSRVRKEYDDRIARLPIATRRLLVLVAADEQLDVRTLGRAAEAGGGSLSALAPAEAAGLVHESDGAVRFRFPLLRAAVYRSAAASDRRTAHRLLADVLPADADAAPPSEGAPWSRAEAAARLRRAWHLAALLETDAAPPRPGAAATAAPPTAAPPTAAPPTAAPPTAAPPTAAPPTAAPPTAAPPTAGPGAADPDPAGPGAAGPGAASPNPAVVAAAGPVAGGGDVVGGGAGRGDVVGELAAAAAAVRGSGDHSAASVAAERVAELSAEAGDRASHLLAAAQDAWLAGQPHRAGVLLARVRPPQPETALHGFRDLLRGEIELRTGLPAAAQEHLIQAATRLGEPHRTAAMIALIHAGEPDFLAGDQRRYLSVLDRVLALRTGHESPEAELMFEFCAGMSATFNRRHREAVAPLRRVLELAPQHDDPTLLVWASLVACILGQESLGLGLSVRARAAAQVRGEVAVIPRTLELTTYAQLWLGRHPSAAASAEEGLQRARELGQVGSASFHLATLALLAVPRGDEQTCVVRARAAIAEADDRGLAMSVAMANWALAALDLTVGRTAEAASRLQVLVSDAGAGRSHPLVRMMAAPHFVEAALRCGDRQAASTVGRYFTEWADATGSPAPKALAARIRAMVATEPGVAEENYREAMRLHLLGDHDFERARTELLYGHELRRRRGSLAARNVLHSALETFERLDANPWAEACHGELRAAGEASGPPKTNDSLTPQQLQIAGLAAQGATNREIAAKLYLSVRTVDHHMRNIFVRLGVRSRVELVRLMF
ncbi:helix-turn-helix transcriptional regulator [Cryptosporangium phraense]|uniref:AAA family ATPase n=1 Tax=Cryptosporangium phraense TaxID=2593070 RepID=A0A545AWI3_9ACTN|nr:LuxR family transcriptional regulator [Cryptosporangium phraense]TQS45680.1 AAA family ATPase [Cryptosporangium phraense]